MMKNKITEIEIVSSAQEILPQNLFCASQAQGWACVNFCGAIDIGVQIK
jgi:hypothetical protein